MAEIQTNVNVDIVTAPETVFGVAAPTNDAGARLLRRVGSTLQTTKDAYTSAEVRSDQQVADMRHGTRRGAGAIEGELSIGAYDPEIEAAMRGTWAAGITASEADFTTVVATNATGVLTFSGGNPITKGFRVGDVIRLTGVGVSAANRAVNFRITSFSGANNRTVAVSPAPTDMASVSTFGVIAPGRKVANGVVRRSFTLEQRMAEVDMSDFYTGARVVGASFRLPPTGMATVSFEYLAKNGELLKGAAAPYFTAPAAQSAKGVLAAVNGAIRVAGAERGIVTGFDINVSLGASSQPVVGSNFVPDIFYGVTTVTGNISVFLDGPGLVEAFLNEQEFEIVTLLEAAGTPPFDFMCFNIQRAKMSGKSQSIGADGGVIISFPFQALIKQGAAGFDDSTMVIQSFAA